MKSETIAKAAPQKVAAKVAETLSASGSYREAIDQVLSPARDQAHLILDRLESYYPNMDFGSIYPFLQTTWRSFAAGCSELGTNAVTNAGDFGNWLQVFCLTFCQVVVDIFSLMWAHICQFSTHSLASCKSFCTWCFIMTIMFLQDCVERLEKVPIPMIMGAFLCIGFLPIIYYTCLKPKKKVSNTFTPRVKGKARENDGVEYRLFSAISPPSVFKAQADVVDDIAPEDAIEAEGNIEGADEPCEDDDDKVSVLSVASSAVSALSNASRKLAKKATKAVKKAVKPILEEVAEGDEEDESEDDLSDDEDEKAEQQEEESPEPVKKRRPAFKPIGPDGHAIEAPVRRSKRLAGGA